VTSKIELDKKTMDAVHMLRDRGIGWRRIPSVLILDPPLAWYSIRRAYLRQHKPGLTERLRRLFG
jgi:hypothetical protein